MNSRCRVGSSTKAFFFLWVSCDPYQSVFSPFRSKEFAKALLEAFRRLVRFCDAHEESVSHWGVELQLEVRPFINFRNFEISKICEYSLEYTPKIGYISRNFVISSRVLQIAFWLSPRQNVHSLFCSFKILILTRTGEQKQFYFIFKVPW